MKQQLLSALVISLLASTSCVPAQAAAKIGVTAAVNKQAKSTLPSGRVRTVVLGNKVVFKERINTSGSGLVQILFTDGSSLTVGANASLVIDQYVYNSANGTGKLAVSFGKGVMRFVGGKLSKNKGGVTIRTTVGTAGIRGGMANIAVRNGKGIFSFLFGKELSFVGPDGQRRRIYQPGYTLLAEIQGARKMAKLIIRRTEKSDTAFFQESLTGQSGQSGGARRKPTNGLLANGPLPPRNSKVPLPRIKPHINPQTVIASPLEDLENGLLDLSNAFDPVGQNDPVTTPPITPPGTTVRPVTTPPGGFSITDGSTGTGGR